MNNKRAKIEFFAGLILAISGIIIDTTMNPYQKLGFPLDMGTIGIIVIGLVLPTGTIIKYFDNVVFEDIIIAICILVIPIYFYIDLIFSARSDTSFHSTFLNAFIKTYLISPMIIVFQVLQFSFNRRFILVGLFILGIIWTIVAFYELSNFLYVRQTDVQNTDEPNYIWPYVSRLYVVALWTYLTFIKWNKHTPAHRQ